jgi:hypothetical protein
MLQQKLNTEITNGLNSVWVCAAPVCCPVCCSIENGGYISSVYNIILAIFGLIYGAFLPEIFKFSKRVDQQFGRYQTISDEEYEGIEEV